MDATESAIGLHQASESPEVSKALPDGSRVVLVAVLEGIGWRVDHVLAAGPVAVHATLYPDEARAVYDAYDGVATGWHPAYLPVGKVHDAKDRTTQVHAVGVDVEGCVRAFLASMGDALRDGSLHWTWVDAAADDTGFRFQWSASFSTDVDGTSFKAAGRRVPGGLVMTWWK